MVSDCITAGSAPRVAHRNAHKLRLCRSSSAVHRRTHSPHGPSGPKWASMLER